MTDNRRDSSGIDPVWRLSWCYSRVKVQYDETVFDLLTIFSSVDVFPQRTPLKRKHGFAPALMSRFLHKVGRTACHHEQDYGVALGDSVDKLWNKPPIIFSSSLLDVGSNQFWPRISDDIARSYYCVAAILLNSQRKYIHHMPPQKRTENMVDIPPQQPVQAEIRRSGSESDFSVMGDESSTRQYRVRKSSLIG